MLAKWCRLCYSAIIQNIVNRNQQKSEQDIESQTSGFRGSMLYLSTTEQCVLRHITNLRLLQIWNDRLRKEVFF